MKSNQQQLVFSEGAFWVGVGKKIFFLCGGHSDGGSAQVRCAKLYAQSHHHFRSGHKCHNDGRRNYVIRNSVPLNEGA